MTIPEKISEALRLRGSISCLNVDFMEKKAHFTRRATPRLRWSATNSTMVVKANDAIVDVRCCSSLVENPAT